MLKFLLIIGLVVYAIYKIGSLFFRAGAASQHFRNPNRPNFGGNANTNSKAKRSEEKFKGGEYIDYEEIK